MQKVIITGGAGFIGSHLSDQLISQGVEVIIIDNLSTGKKENLNSKAFFVDIDLSMVNVKELHWQLFPMKFFRNVDVVFHLAATPQVQYSIDNPTDNNNLISLINTLELSKKIEAKKFVFSSSSAVYGNPKHTPISEEHPTNPLSPYALHKLIGEQYCKMYSEIYDLTVPTLNISPLSFLVLLAHNILALTISLTCT